VCHSYYFYSNESPQFTLVRINLCRKNYNARRPEKDIFKSSMEEKRGPAGSFKRYNLPKLLKHFREIFVHSVSRVGKLLL
jgi:hypothetical protein